MLASGVADVALAVAKLLHLKQNLLDIVAVVENAAAKNGDVLAVPRVEAAVDDRTLVDVDGLVGMQLHDARLMIAGTVVQDVLARLDAVLRSAVGEDVEVVVIAVQLERVAARFGDCEAEGASLALELHALGGRTDFGALEVPAGSHGQRGLPLEPEPDHPAELALLDLALMSGPAAIEGHCGAAGHKHREVFDIKQDGVAVVQGFVREYGIYMRHLNIYSFQTDGFPGQILSQTVSYFFGNVNTRKQAAQTKRRKGP